MNHRRSLFSTDGATYAYEIRGKGPPLLLMHGFTGSRLTWKNVIKQWENQYMCITLDMPGHGETVIHSPRTMDRFSSDIKQFLAYLKLEKVHLIGYSMGGRAALSFALLYPDYVASLVLESASPGLEKEADRQKRRSQDTKLAEKIEKKGLASFVDYWESIPMFASQKALPKEIQKEVRKERLSQTETGLVQSLQFMGTGVQPSWWEALQTCHVKTLLITGSKDEKFININKRMLLYLPYASYSEVEDAGHAVHVEQPAVFGKLVVSFLKQR
ncbi:2-succinyl-6-hydroxy-2,4-cyclohexadiene-1-carboxylate synthase [Virgibacillus sp. W0430]|uniref:2-succinyl-6-hydroxy-2, 4-cyclohexadiene-1-carboxylate synthase n=1 Tax=Virgibacillus sp. W0430 TaxID=3391580 RepID=UPI003F467385